MLQEEAEAMEMEEEELKMENTTNEKLVSKYYNNLRTILE